MITYADSIEMVEVDSTSCSVHAWFGYLTYRGEAMFTREVFPARDSIALTLELFKHNWGIIPAVRAVDSYYKMAATDTCRTVVYRQKVRLDRNVGWIYLGIVRWQLRRFARTLIHDIVGVTGDCGASQ